MGETEGNSSMLSAAINLAKLCIGSGLLALPHATSRGGLVFAPIMTGIIAIWNAIAVAMMIRCKHFTENYSYPSGISSTYSKIAYVGAGWFGSYLTDFSIIVTLIGVCISFQITFAVLLQDLSFGSNNQIDSYSHSHSHHDHHTNHSVINQNHNSFLSYNTLALISGIIVLPLSCIKDINILSYFSFIGLVCLVCATIAIMFFGFTMYGNNMMNNPLEYNNNKYGYNTLPLFPQDIGSLTSFLGVSVFCFGLCSLAFPVEESMKKKGEFNTAVMFSIVFVWTVYAIVGDLGALLYAHDPSGIKDNILQNLPTDSIVASVVRFCMAGVCVLTFPLTMIAPAEMIESIIMQAIAKSNSSKSVRLNGEVKTYRSINNGIELQSNDNSNGKYENGNGYRCRLNGDEPSGFGLEDSTERVVIDYQLEAGEPSFFFRCCNRTILVAISTMISTYIPYFSMIIALLGCFTVSILSFVLPPFLHLRIVTKELTERSSVARSYLADQSMKAANSSGVSKLYSPNIQYYIDVSMTIIGTLLCIVTTVITTMDVVDKLRNGNI